MSEMSEMTSWLSSECLVDARLSRVNVIFFKFAVVKLFKARLPTRRPTCREYVDHVRCKNAIGY